MHIKKIANDDFCEQGAKKSTERFGVGGMVLRGDRTAISEAWFARSAGWETLLMPVESNPTPAQLI